MSVARAWQRELVSTIRWAPEAARRLKRVPFFIRPFVKRRAESVAKERGLTQVTSDLLDSIKEREHRGRS